MKIVRCFRDHLIWTVLLLSIYYGFAVTSAQCLNPRQLCMKLCCEKAQFYNLESHQCEIIPEKQNVTWIKQMKLSDTFYKPINVLKEFEHDVKRPCRKPLHIEEYEGSEVLNVIHIFGDYCFTPHYLKDSRQYILMPLHMGCEGVKEESKLQEKEVHMIKKSYLILYFAGTSLTILLILPTILIYMSIKELRQNIQSKLFVCYGITMLIPALVMMPAVYHYFYPLLSGDQKDILNKFSTYFGISSIHWSNAICYEMRRSFQQTDTEKNPKKDQKRFICYSLYVWGMALFVVLIKWMHIFRHMENVIMIGFLIINTSIFLMISFDICRTRLRVAKMKDGTHSNFKNVKIILRLSALMGLSQISYYVIYLVSELYRDSFMTTIFALNVVSIVDALLIFLLFVMRKNVRNILKARFSCCCCCRENKDIIISRDHV